MHCANRPLTLLVKEIEASKRRDELARIAGQLRPKARLGLYELVVERFRRVWRVGEVAR